MNTLLNIFIASLLVTASSYVLANTDEAVLYRYINAQGTKVVAYSIPPAFVGKGYEVLNSQGLVLEVVAAELSEDEKARLKLLEQQQQKLDKWDRRLLSRYSFTSEIEEAKVRRLNKIDANKNLIRSQINNINREIEKHQATAAAQERRNGKVSSDILDLIDSLFTERLISEQKLDNTNVDFESESKRFDKDVERFKLIKMREANAKQPSNN